MLNLKCKIDCKDEGGLYRGKHRMGNTETEERNLFRFNGGHSHWKSVDGQYIVGMVIVADVIQYL